MGRARRAPPGPVQIARGHVRSTVLQRPRTVAFAAIAASIVGGACGRAREPAPLAVRSCAVEDDLGVRCHLFCREGGSCVDYDPARPVEIAGEDGRRLPHAALVGTTVDGKLDPGRRSPVDTVVVHATELTLTESGRTLFDDPGKSIHFMVDARGRIYQLASVTDTAWHAANRVVNARSIGIEHVGCSLAQGCEDDARRSGAVAPYTPATIAASATLVRALARRFPAIAIDRRHVIGHDQVANRTRIAEDAPPCAASVDACEADPSYGGANHHVDPGLTWDWCGYMAAIGGACRDELDACPRRDGAWACAENVDDPSGDGGALFGTAALRCVRVERREMGVMRSRWIAEQMPCSAPCRARAVGGCGEPR